MNRCDEHIEIKKRQKNVYTNYRKIPSKTEPQSSFTEKNGKSRWILNEKNTHTCFFAHVFSPFVLIIHNEWRVFFSH